MASNAGWDKTVPSGTSLINVGDDDIRSLKSSMQAWWEEEHYATDGSATSAGEHKPGSARAYIGTTSQLSNPEIGRFFWSTNDEQLYVAPSGSSWSQVAGVAADSVNTFTASQFFTRIIRSEGSSADSQALNTRVAGDSQGRFSITDDGTLAWGDGSGVRSTNLYRQADNHLKSDDTFDAASLVVGGGPTIAGITSGSTVLASHLNLAAGADNTLTMKVTDSNVTLGDPVFVGLWDDGDQGEVMASGQVDSSRSLRIRFYNPSNSNVSIPSGQTIRYVIFRF